MFEGNQMQRHHHGDPHKPKPLFAQAKLSIKKKERLKQDIADLRSRLGTHSGEAEAAELRWILRSKPTLQPT
jgi:hypothetical protein